MKKGINSVKPAEGTANPIEPESIVALPVNILLLSSLQTLDEKTFIL